MPSFRALCLLASALAGSACSGGTEPGVDGSAPQVRIDAPLANATVAAQVAINITAVDDFGVDKVSVFIDGTLLQPEMFTPPFHTIFNTLSVTNNAPHVIRAEARDLAGNLGSTEITVTVSNGVQAPPAVPH